MSYSDLIRQEGEYTYSANIQFDIENDKKLLRFIPNQTTIHLLREYFTDMTRSQPYSHSRILYGSYGTGKSHFLTVLSQLLGKTCTNGIAFDTFLDRVHEYDARLATDIKTYNNNKNRKPFLIVPIVFDFDDFNRCLFFSLKKRLDAIGVKINFKSFYEQAAQLLSRWQSSEESAARLVKICEEQKIDVESLEQRLANSNSEAEPIFLSVFEKMTFGVKFIYESTNMVDALNQAVDAIATDYCGIVFVFDEFGRYIEDNIKSIKVKEIQDIAEYCDHSDGNVHILLVSHMEINQYTQRYGKNLANEWKKVEGRFRSDSINNKQDQCLSLIRNILTKKEPAWSAFKRQHLSALNSIYEEALDFKGFLIDSTTDDNPFEYGFPLHPISLFALDRLSKKVAQNDRTFFTYLASKEEHSLYHFLNVHSIDDFHFVGIDAIFDYFEDSIKAVQSDSSYEWYRNLQTAVAKEHCGLYDSTVEVRILKVIATIGIIGDASVLSANKRTILSVIDVPHADIEQALQGLCDRKVVKYSGTYDRYDFFDASVFDVDGMICEESLRFNDDVVANVLNEQFVNFVLYPHQYNRTYKISRVFVPLFATASELKKKSFMNRFGSHYDGLLIMLLSNSDAVIEEAQGVSSTVDRSIILAKSECERIIDTAKKYLAARFLETGKSKYMDRDPAFEKELEYNIGELSNQIRMMVEEWRFISDDVQVFSNGEYHSTLKSFDSLSMLASDIMFSAYPDSLIVNNELINKNSISPSITTAKKNAIRAMLQGAAESDYYDLPYLSPDYIAVRSVLAKNGFINAKDAPPQNTLPDGSSPQKAILQVFLSYLEKAKDGIVEFGEFYNVLKSSPFGVRDGYLSLLMANAFLPYRKSLIIISHDIEQELTVELFEDIVKKPDEYNFTVASWNQEQLRYLDAIEEIYQKYIDQSLLSKNRTKALYEAMMSHYRSIPKFARTTQLYVSSQTIMYRQIMERSYTNYSKFFFVKLNAMSGEYTQSVAILKNCKHELENSLAVLCHELKKEICGTFALDIKAHLAGSLSSQYRNFWEAKRKKSFDYYTNGFLEYVSKIDDASSDTSIVAYLAKTLTGIELSYWNDNHKNDFDERIHEIKIKLDAYQDTGVLSDAETRMTLTSANGEIKTVVFDDLGLSDLSKTVKNKINSTFGNFGLSITYDDKVQILLSLLNDLMEGK